MITSVSVAKRLMKLRESTPTFDRANIGERREVFSHDAFIHGSKAEMNHIMLKSSESKERDEREFWFDNYFGFPLKPYLQGKTILDLGCFTGGRTAAWFKDYALFHASGIDIESTFIEAATQYAIMNGLSCDFRLGKR